MSDISGGRMHLTFIGWTRDIFTGTPMDSILRLDHKPSN
jgi:hypothetical protein